jgi:endoglucanase
VASNLLGVIMLKKIIHICCLLASMSCAGALYAGVADGRYILVNKYSGKVVDVSGGNQGDGANVIQWSLSSGLNQRWTITALADGYYSIRAVHSTKALDVFGWNTSNGADVKQYSYHGGDNQQWGIVNNGDGYYRIVSRLSGKVLDISGASASDGGNVHMWDFNGADSQLWSLQPVGASGYAKTAVEVTSDMGAGWNLGNTMDAVGGETNWGNPLTERYMIDAIAKRGFKTLRIPVTWEGHMSAGGEYSIDASWLNRVEQIVNYGLDNGMYVIINVHHDEWVKPTIADKNNTLAKLNAVWSQVATHFKNYNQYLIFETLNEPRAHQGTSLEWSGNVENYNVINELNRSALAVIRSVGNNNASRMVMIPGYAASPWNTQTDHLTVPSDPMVAVSTHGYIPYDFVENPNGANVFTQQDRDLIDYVLNELHKKYISQGVPVVMGEWGTIDKGNTAERLAYAKYYVSKAHAVGIPLVVWDNNALGGGRHDYLLYDRGRNFWPFDGIVDAIISSSK